ncbi:hypothetical protein BC826DRAFT_662566 [Russula brevipes]|nr:hypothetical protein BC826DRAFT_662566 [Russula brevipes]
MPKISEKSKSQPVTRMITKAFVCRGCGGSIPSVNFDAHTNKCKGKKRTAEEREKRSRDMDEIRACDTILLFALLMFPSHLIIR